MGISKHLIINQVLLFKSPSRSRRFGESLWAMLDEAASYLTPTSSDGWLEVPIVAASGETAQVRPEFRKWYVAPELPEALEIESTRFLQLDGADAKKFWELAERRQELYDHHTLGVSISAMLNLEAAAIVLDQAIAPPADWRYLIWSGYPGGAVISTPPLDPQYWGFVNVEDSLRVNDVKRRARAATMSVMGSLLGLSRCENPQCFMYAAVDSASTLDHMRALGVEHNVVGLPRGTFPIDESQPNEVLTPVSLRVET